MDSLRNLCKSTEPIYIFHYGPSSKAYQQIRKIIKGRRTDCCG